MRRMEKMFKALADRNRLRILKMLEVKPMCVCEVTSILGIAQSSVSRHLGILRDAGLIDDRKDGLWVEYSLVSTTDDICATILTGLRRWGKSDQQVREDREKAAHADRSVICGKE